MRSGHENGEAAWLPDRDEHDGLQGNRHARDLTNVRLSYRSRRGRAYHHAGIRLRRGQEGHDQTAQFAAGEFFPYAADDGREIPEDRPVDEPVHVFWDADLF